MNMIVNKSDLVGYEAVETKAAKKKALAKLVEAWESKQARNAKRFGGLGFLAVSLAACNSSSDDTTTTTTTTTETTPTVTGLSNEALETTSDTMTDVFTSVADSVTATELTLTAGDVLVDSTSGDGDTLTVELSAGSNTAPQTIVGIETITFNNNSLTTNSTIDASGITGAGITINHTANELVAPTASTVTGIGSGNSVTFGTNVTGAASATVVANASNVTINGGASTLTVDTTAGSVSGVTVNAGTGTGTLTVNTGASDSNITINGGASGPMAVTLGATNSTVAITGGSTAGTLTAALNSATGVSITTGANDEQMDITGIATNANLTMTKAGTTAAGGAMTINVGGSGASDAVTISASGEVNLDTNAGAGTDQVETLTLKAHGASATYNLNAADAPTTVNLSGGTGDGNVTLVLEATAADAATAITSDSSLVMTVEVGATDIAADTDLSTITADLIDITASQDGGGPHTMTFQPSQSIKLSKANTNAMSFDISDGSATTTVTDGSLTVDLATAQTGAITIDATAASDNVATLNLTASADQGGLAIIDGAATADQALTVNISGASDVTTTAAFEAAHLNASSMTGSLDATVDPDLLKITGGSGNDTFRGVVADGEYVLAGGAGNDVYIAAAASSNISVSLTGIEVLDVTAGTSDWKASQLNNATYIIRDTSAGKDIQIDAGATMDLTTLSLAGMSFQNTATTFTVSAATFDTTQFNSLQGFTITGSANADSITGSPNADTLAGGGSGDTLNGGAGDDTLNGGAGDDSLNGEAGADTIDGGAGDDTITGGTGADAITTGAGGDSIVALEGDMAAGTAAGEASTAGFDSIADFTVGETASTSDKITYATADTSIVQSATATATATSAAISAKGIATFHADDDTLAEKIVATNAGINTGTEAAGATAAFMHGSDAYVFIHDGTTALAATDMLIKLTGIDLTASGSDTVDVGTANTIFIT